MLEEVFSDHSTKNVCSTSVTLGGRQELTAEAYADASPRAAAGGPAIGSVSNSSKKLKTQSTMTAISAGLEAYRNTTGELAWSVFCIPFAISRISASDEMSLIKAATA